MRKLLLLSGIPGSGKTTFINENKLNDYTLSADSLRVLLGGYKLNYENHFQPNDSKQKQVFDLQYSIFEERCKDGLFTIIDNTNVYYPNYKKFIEIAQRYHYQIFYIDFEISIEDAIKIDKNRESSKKVGENTLFSMHEKKKNNNEIKQFIKISKDSWLEDLTKNIEIDANKYDEIFFISDIQGCSNPLNNFLNEQYNKNNLYVFLGDYLDRGTENDKVLETILKLSNEKNCLFLIGNHEKPLYAWSNDIEFKHSEFKTNTKPQLEKANISKKETNNFLKKCIDCAIIKFNSKKIFISHSGLPFCPTKKDLLLMNNNDLIHSNLYNQPVDSMFEKNTTDEIYQIHGHRNFEQRSFSIKHRSFSLENKVEYGFPLKIMKVNQNGICELLYDNNNDNKIPENIIKDLNHNDFIYKKELEDFLVSYNFTHKAFNHKIWNDLTIKARGLFINPQNNTVIARSYEKFFNLNEMPETSLDSLKNLKYPLTVYLKDNGFLGILSTAPNGELLFCSKSTNKSDFANYFKTIFESNHQKEADSIRKFIMQKNISMVFEVIDVINDPHIIEYQKNHCVLLDIIKNQMTFDNFTYEYLQENAERYNLRYKKIVKKINDYQELLLFIDETQKENHKFEDSYTEGYVVADQNNFIFKIKTPHYSNWKRVRSLIYKKNKGLKIDLFNENPFVREYFDFVSRNNYWDLNIIEIKKEFYKKA